MNNKIELVDVSEETDNIDYRVTRPHTFGKSTNGEGWTLGFIRKANLHLLGQSSSPFEGRFLALDAWQCEIGYCNSIQDAIQMILNDVGLRS
jgi:hypothetical protein